MTDFENTKNSSTKLCLRFMLVLTILVSLLLLLFCGCSSVSSDTSSDGDNTTIDGDNIGTDGDNISEDGESTTDGDSNNPDGDIKIDGDDDSDVDDDFFAGDPIPCDYGVAACPWGFGCHEGFCGRCTDNDECRKMDACLDNGKCGACTKDKQCGSNQDCRHGFCMPKQIKEINILIAEQDLADLLNDEFMWWELTYDCRVELDGVLFEDTVEIRQLGNSSQKYPKKSVRLKFPEDAEHPGYARKINLKADYNDPAFMRSYLSFEIIRRLTNIPTPRTRYRRVSFNGKYYGLMTEIERIGGKFLEENGRNRDNSLYEVDEAFVTGAFVKHPDMASYVKFYAKKAGDESDYSDLLHFINDVLWVDFKNSNSLSQTDTTVTKQNVNLKPYLAYLASMVVIQNIDNVESNFHFSWQKDKTGKMAWEFYPWDMDISLGCRFNHDSEMALCLDLYHDDWHRAGVLSSIDSEPVYPNEVWFNMLMHLLLNDKESYDYFVSLICEYLESDFYNVQLPNLIEAISETVWQSVKEDPNDMNKNMDEFVAAKMGILDYLQKRKQWLKSEDEMGCF